MNIKHEDFAVYSMESRMKIKVLQFFFVCSFSFSRSWAGLCMLCIAYATQLWCLAFAFLNNQLEICFSFSVVHAYQWLSTVYYALLSQTEWTDALLAKFEYFSIRAASTVFSSFSFCSWNKNLIWVHQTWNVVKFHVL